MAEVNDVTMEEVAVNKETTENHNNLTPTQSEPPQKDVVDDPMEPSNEDNNKAESGKRIYTEEEKAKRREYFKQLREKRRLAREKYRQNYVKKFLNRSSSVNNTIPKDIFISYNMTEEEKKMLDFYSVRFSVLKSENEQLHKRLANLVKENTTLLQMGPPITQV